MNIRKNKEHRSKEDEEEDEKRKQNSLKAKKIAKPNKNLLSFDD